MNVPPWSYITMRFSGLTPHDWNSRSVSSAGFSLPPYVIASTFRAPGMCFAP